MNNLKLAYIVSDIEKSLEFEWTAKYFSQKFDLLFLLIGKDQTPLISFLQESGVRSLVISDEEFHSPLQKWFRVLSILRQERPDVIHAHMWRAVLLSMTSAFLLPTKKRIFTRHHAVVHYTSQPQGRKWDVLCNWLATDIVAISENVRRILLERDHARPSKVHLVHHGFDLQYFSIVSNTSIERLRLKYDIQNDRWPVIGVISRYLELKGIQFIIPAFQKIRELYPSAHLILANAHGDYANTIRRLLQKLPPNSFSEILFENDIAALYRLFDVFVHTPVDAEEEAFGQTYVEALAAGIPSVFSYSGVSPEFILDGTNGLVVPYCDSASIEKAIVRILTDQKLRDCLVRNGRDSVRPFSLNFMLSRLEELYV